MKPVLVSGKDFLLYIIRNLFLEKYDEIVFNVKLFNINYSQVTYASTRSMPINENVLMLGSNTDII